VPHTAQVNILRPEALRLLAPQRGLTAPVEKQKQEQKQKPNHSSAHNGIDWSRDKCQLPQMSNSYCHSGRAGGSPTVLESITCEFYVFTYVIDFTRLTLKKFLISDTLLEDSLYSILTAKLQAISVRGQTRGRSAKLPAGGFSKSASKDLPSLGT
jgi:hypothetical protein